MTKAKTMHLQFCPTYYVRLLESEPTVQHLKGAESLTDTFSSDEDGEGEVTKKFLCAVLNQGRSALMHYICFGNKRPQNSVDCS